MDNRGRDGIYKIELWLLLYVEKLENEYLWNWFFWLEKLLELLINIGYLFS